MTDISFECPKCQGPLIVEQEHVGIQVDCPHCLQPIVIPRGVVVDKETFVEPLTLRRLLKNIRDMEWERLRRDGQIAKAKLHRATEELNAMKLRLSDVSTALDKLRNEGGSGDIAALRRQVQQISEQFVQANRTFIAGQQAREKQAAQLQQELAATRTEAKTIRRKHDALVAALDRIQHQAPAPPAAPALPAEGAAAQQRIAELEAALTAQTEKVRLLESAVRATFKAAHAVKAAPRSDEPQRPLTASQRLRILEENDSAQLGMA